MDEEFFKENTPKYNRINLDFAPVALSTYMKTESITKIKMARLKPKGRQNKRKVTVPISSSDGRKLSKTPNVQAKKEQHYDP